MRGDTLKVFAYLTAAVVVGNILTAAVGQVLSILF